MSTPQTQLYLVRHGETPWVLSGQHTGKTDILLTKKGEFEASCLKNRLKEIPFSAVFTSPLKRSLRTCELAGFQKQALVCDELQEWDYGDYEGLTSKEILKQSPHWNLFEQGVPEGESPEDVRQRAQQFLKQIEELSGNILIFSHGHFSRVIATTWMNIPTSYGFLLSLSATSLSMLGIEKNRHVLKLWNDTSHLKELLNQ